MVQNRSSESGSPVNEDHKAIPVAAMVESIIGCKWSVRLLGLLADGCPRPSALLRACPGLSAKVMNERLQKMMRFGIARRTVFGDKPDGSTTALRRHRLSPTLCGSEVSVENCESPPEDSMFIVMPALSLRHNTRPVR